MKPLKVGGRVAVYDGGIRIEKTVNQQDGTLVWLFGYPTSVHRKQCRLLTKKKSVRVTREKLQTAFHGAGYSCLELFEELCKALGLDEEK